MCLEQETKKKCPKIEKLCTLFGITFYIDDPVMTTFKGDGGGHSAATSNANKPFGNCKQVSFFKPDSILIVLVEKRPKSR